MWSRSRAHDAMPDACCATYESSTRAAPHAGPAALPPRPLRRRATRGCACCGAARRSRAVPQRRACCARRLVAERDRAQQVAARTAGQFGRCQGGRHDAASRMGERPRVGVVGLVGVGRHPVGERCIDGRGEDLGPQHERFGPAAVHAHVIRRDPPRPQPRPGDDRRDRIEQVEGGLLRDLGRQRAVERPGDVRGKGFHRRHSRLLGASLQHRNPSATKGKA